MKSNNFYILSSIGIVYSLILLTWQGLNGFIFVTPIVLFFIALFKTVQFLIKAEYLSAAIAVLSGLLMVMISIMLDFTYYNTLIALVIVLAALWVYRLNSSEQKYSISNKILLAAIIVNAAFLIIPHETFMRLEASVDDEYIAWKPNLSFDDFSVIGANGELEIPDTAKYDAFITNTFYAKINTAYNYPPALVVSCIDKSKSFRKASIGQGDEHLLLHEQIHFNINKHYADKANDSLSKLWGVEEEQLKAVITYFLHKVSAEDNLYDSLTNHGLDTGQQGVWTKKFAME